MAFAQDPTFLRNLKLAQVGSKLPQSHAEDRLPGARPWPCVYNAPARFALPRARLGGGVCSPVALEREAAPSGKAQGVDSPRGP